MRKIIEFLNKYEGFYFKAKSNEQSDTRVSVNIKLCLDNSDLTKIVRDFFVAPIKETFGQIPLDLIEHADFQGLLKKICNVVNTGKEKLQKEIVNIAKEHQENLGSKAAEQPEKTASGEFDSVIKKIRDKLDIPRETDISAALSKNNFEVFSGPINLLHNIQKGEKIQIEFDRFESSKNSPTRLQINSTGRQLAFKDLSEALKVLFKID